MTDLSLNAAPGTVLFVNADWQVLPDGLEHRGTGYFIERDLIAGRRGDGLWSWPLQLAEKRWCAPGVFREAFLAAVERFGFERDEALSRSFAVGFGLRPGAGGCEGFVALSEFVRPKSASRRPSQVDTRSAGRSRAETARRVPASANA